MTCEPPAGTVKRGGVASMSSAGLNTSLPPDCDQAITWSWMVAASAPVLRTVRAATLWSAESVALTGPTWNEPAQAWPAAIKRNARPQAAWRTRERFILESDGRNDGVRIAAGGDILP